MSKQVLAVLCVVAAVVAGPGRQIDWRAVEDSLANVRPWQRIRGLTAQGLYDEYLGHTCWSPMQDSGLVCAGRWSYGPSYKVSVQADTSDTLVLLTRGSGATVARFRSADSVVLQPLGEIDCYGIPHRAVFQDTLVCVGVQRGGTGLEVFNVGDPSAPSRLAYVSLPSVNDIAVADTLVCLVCADDTLRVYSIADPRNPVRLGACRDSSDLAMCYADGYCYLVHSSGVNIVDVRDPANPLRAGRIAGHAPLAVQVRDSICCLTTENDGFLVYDVGDPAVPVPLGSLSLPAAADLCLPPTCDTVAYTSYFHIVSLSDPAHPRLISQMNSPGWDDGVSAVPDLNRALIADHFDGVVVVDISDPAVPVVDTMALGGGLAVNLSIACNRLYTGSYNAGFAVLDVTDPALPTRLGGLDYVGLLPTCLAVAGQDSFAYVSWEPGPQFRSVDVSDPRNPVLSGGDTLFARPEDMVLRDTFVYCAMVRRLQIVNVARPREPVLVGNCVTQDGVYFGLAVQDTLAYVVADGFQIVNIARPNSPFVVSTTSAGATGIAVRDTFAYVPYAYDTVWVFSVANPAAPRRLTATPASVWPWDVALAESLLYVGTSQGVDVYGLEDPAQPRYVDHVATPYGVRRLHYAAPYLYAALWDAGVAVYETTMTGMAERGPVGQQSLGGARAVPNPASGRVRLVGAARAASVDVHDAAGRAVVVEATRTQGGDIELNLAGLEPGVYFVQVVENKKAEVLRIVRP